MDYYRLCFCGQEFNCAECFTEHLYDFHDGEQFSLAEYDQDPDMAYDAYIEQISSIENMYM